MKAFAVTLGILFFAVGAATGQPRAFFASGVCLAIPMMAGKKASA